MRSNMIFRTFLAASLAAAALMSVSCTKEMEPGTQTSAQEGRVITITVQDSQWIDETRSAYTPGEGVGLTGSEKLHLFYFNGTKKIDAGVATPTGTSGQYSFTVPSGVGDGTKFYSLMPYNKTAMALNSSGASVCTRLSPVQNPGANTFDPCFDYLAGKPFELSGNTATIDGFKRFFAPLKMTISGLESGEKIYAARLAFSQAPAKAENQAMTSSFYIKLEDTFAETLVSNPDEKAMGNAVSALYAGGLAAEGGSWPVWFMVNPVTISSGATMTVEVSTASKTYTRQITLPSDLVMAANSLNALTVDFSAANRGDGAEGETFNFTSATALSGSAIINGSAGTAVTWTFSGNVLYNSTGSKDPDSGLSNAMNVNSQSFTVPTITSKNVTGLKIYTHAATNYNGNASYLYLKTSEGTTLATYDYNLYTHDGAASNLYIDGGCITIDLPNGYETLSGLKVEGNSRANLISAITLFTADSGQVGPEEATGDDLLAEFKAGKKITINGVAYHKDTHTYYEEDLATATNTNLQRAGVHFLTGTKDFGSSTNFKLPNSVVYISQNKKTPASLSASQFQPYYDAVFKYIAITGYNGANAFPSNQAKADMKFVFENCTINTNGELARDVNATYAMDLICRNCNITYGKTVSSNTSCLFALKGKVAASNSAKEITFENNTITCAATTATKDLIDLSNGAYAPADLVVTFKGNTVTGAANGTTGLFVLKTLKSFSIADNSFSAVLDADSYALGTACAPSAASTVTGNTFTASTGSSAEWKGICTKELTNVTASGNDFKTE